MNIAPDLMAKARTAKSAQELLQLAEDNGIELTAEQAEQYYDQLVSTAELADDELDNVSGGGCGKTKIDEYYYHTGDYVDFDPGDGLKRGQIVFKGYMNNLHKVLYKIRYRFEDYYWVELHQIKGR